MKNTPYKTARTNGLPDGEHDVRNVQDAENWIKTFKKCAFVGLCYIIVSQGTVQKTFKKNKVTCILYRHGPENWTLWTVSSYIKVNAVAASCLTFSFMMTYK